MKSLLIKLQETGLTEQESRKSLETIHHWLENNYPVLATVSRQNFIGEQQIQEDMWAPVLTYEQRFS